MTAIRTCGAIAVLVASVGCATGTASQNPRPSEQPIPPRATEVDAGERGEVPIGQELDVRLQTALSSETSQVEDRFEATTATDLLQDGRVLVPAGSIVRGVVSSADPAGRLDRKGRLTLTFDQIRIDGTEYPIRATATQVFESQGIQGDVAKIGAGAGVGAIVGGILGGAKGALAGVLVGAGGVVAATEGQDVNLPPGTVIRLRFDTPLRPRR